MLGVWYLTLTFKLIGVLKKKGRVENTRLRCEVSTLFKYLYPIFNRMYLISFSFYNSHEVGYFS